MLTQVHLYQKEIYLQVPYPTEKKKNLVLLPKYSGSSDGDTKPCFIALNCFFALILKSLYSMDYVWLNP